MTVSHATTATAAIQTRRLGKHYPGANKASLSNLDLTIQAGEVYGFLGANGAGKSTTIRTLLNFIQPTHGTATILGLDSVSDAVAIKRHVGYLAGDVALYDSMSGQEFLDYMEALQPLKSKQYRQQLLMRFEVDSAKTIRELSKGNRQKLGIVQAFMHQPEVLILDEPTSGLDPLMQETFYELVNEVKSAGACVFLSSHNLSEVQHMCDRIGFIRAGKLVAEHTIQDLAIPSRQTFMVTFKDAVPLAALEQLKTAAVTKLSDRLVRIDVNGDIGPLLGILARHAVIRLTSEESNIEEEFMQLYTDAPAPSRQETKS